MKKLRLLVPAALVPLVLASACGIDDSGDVAGSVNADGSFTVDTANCLDPAAATKEIGDTIKFGWSVALSGPVAATQVRVNNGLQARIDHYNEAESDIGGRAIDFTMKDDAYDPQKAKQNVTEFIERDNVDVLGAAGTGQLAAVADDQNDSCVPLLAGQVAAPQFRDAQTYPWTTTYLPSNTLEMELITQLVTSEAPDAKVGLVYAQSESGESYRTAFKEAAEKAGIEIVVEAPVTTPEEAASQVREAGADVVFNGSVGPDCLGVPEAIARAGIEPEMLIQVSACADAKSIYQAGGAATDGAVLMSWAKQPGSADLESDEAWQEYAAAVTAVGGDPNDNYTIMGWTMMDIVIDSLRTADKDGLTRENIINAARTQTFHPELFLDGIDWSMEPETSLGIAEMQPLRWNAAEGRFDPLGDVLTVSK